jgi:hypothetical protein
MWGGTVLIHVLPNVANRLIHHPDKPDGVFLFGTASSTRITPDNAQSSPLPDPHVSGERGLASLGERVKIDRSYHELGKISLSWAINYGLRH